MAILTAAVLIGLAGLILRDVLRIRNDLNAGQKRLSHLQLTQIDSRASIEATFGTADRRLRAGAGLAAHSPFLGMLTPLPKVGGQINAARDLSRAAAQVADIAYRAASNARTQLDAPRSGPADRLKLIDNLHQDLLTVGAQLDRVRPGANGHLIGTLARARVDLVSKLAKAHTQLADGLQLTGTLRTMLAGPRTYLILAGNNAEMRSGGITTAAGLVRFAGGDMTTGKFITSYDLFLPDQKKVPVPADLEKLYGWMAVGQEWRTTTTSPNWPAVASVYAKMSANSALGPVDGVLFVDVVTLRAVLDVVGPVTVDGTVYRAANVEEQLLFKNYVLYPTIETTNARRDVQSQVANAAFAALRSAPFSLPKLAKSLQGATKGRHLLAWSADPAEQAMWTKIGADGTIGANDFMVSVQNVSASKLDYFIDPKVNMDIQLFSEHQQVDLTVTLTNPRRTQTSAYVEGGSRGYVVPGDQRVYVLLYLPSTAYDLVNHDPQFNTLGTDGPMVVAGLVYIVPYGQTTQVHVSFKIPVTTTYAHLIPASRLRPVQYTINGIFHADDSTKALIPL
ncbi:MAG: DUF4012 domain-containing protein [Actinomycetota bacterium]|nr:DUF4012 domain-containing protein [Actinomycetota bacterium]